ncbi:MAG: ArnT family glycosyltransferase [Terriglobales bacterium]
MAGETTIEAQSTPLSGVGVHNVSPAAALVPPASRPRRAWEWLILAALGLVLLAQLWTSVGRLSITWDEADHLHAGYRYLTCGDFGWNPEHPPLAKMVDAIPLLFQRIRDPFPKACGFPNTRELDNRIGHAFIFANPESALFSARLAASLFAVMLLGVVWVVARSMFGLAAACVAGTLLAFEPNLLAHGALIATDVPAAFGTSASVFALYAYLVNRTRARWLLAGLVTGVAFSLKHSTILLIPILLILAVADPLVQRNREPVARRIGRNLLAVAGMLLLALVVLWTVYGWRYQSRPHGAQTWGWGRPEFAGPVAKAIPRLEDAHLLPEAYLKGLQDVVVTSEVGRPAFILGRLYRRGQWFYFPLAIAIKFSLAVLVLAALSCCAFRFWRARRRELLFLAVLPLVYLGSAMTSGLNMGVRHLLPVMVFVILFASAGSGELLAHSRKAQVGLALLLALHIASSLRAFPNYLSYSNEAWGGPGATYKHLSLSDSDWGQALKQAKAYVDRTPSSPCWIIRAFYATNQDYGIPCGETSGSIQQIPPVHYHGTLIVSSESLAGFDTALGGARLATTFRGREPKAKLGGSALLVYEGDFDLSVTAAYAYINLANQESGRNLDLAQAHAETAAQLSPDSPSAHGLVCSLARTREQSDVAERECNLALKLMKDDPNSTPLDEASMMGFMTALGIPIH